MDALQKILVPTDFSAHADEAFRVALRLAKATGASVVAFHVAAAPAVVMAEGPSPADVRDAKGKNLWGGLLALQAHDPQVRVDHEVIVADKPTVAHILDLLAKRGCDVIVMGTHGHAWLRQRLFGSVTEEVIRRARCPVMVVKAPAHAEALPVPEPGKAAHSRSPPQGQGGK
jgi:nucleotide-binding universal stress UspA family protein